jgi:hypothetical protein
VKVLPSEYRRVLAEQASMPETAGRPAIEEAPPPRPYHSWREAVDDGRPAAEVASHG